MKKIGKQVHMLKTGKNNPRNGEGAFLRLKDGRIMYAYTEYVGDDWTDHATARISACYSSDEGEHWSESSVLFEKPDDALNIMSVSLIRMQNGDMGVLYLEKILEGDIFRVLKILARSSDEGKTFVHTEVPVKRGTRGVNNDRIVRTSKGRLLMPIANHSSTAINQIGPGVLDVYYSDDDGITWNKSKNSVHSPYSDYTQFQEPGVYELPDGRIWMYARTGYGCQYQAFSEDGGETWSEPSPNWRFTSPDSPMLVKTVGEYTVAIFNPLPFTCISPLTEVWGSPKRTPFVCAFCKDGGLSFIDMTYNSRNGRYKSFAENCYYIEDDLTNSYCYPAVIEVEGGFLVAYYHSDGSDVCLNATKITKISFDEID